jgi:phage portal protein BeeE
MSLIADLANMLRVPKNESAPPVPYTANHDLGRMSAYGRSADPQTRHLDMTTVESTLFSVLDLLASDLSTVDWGFYPKTARMNEEQEPLTDQQHLAVKLWDQPNDFMSGEELRYRIEWHYDAVGEGWMLCSFNDFGIPESFWWVRPDRLTPAADGDKFLIGWVYTGPDGEKVPLPLDDPTTRLMRMCRPHPTDPHRGIGPVQTLMTSLGTSLTAQQWIQSFYANDATPGGMIELGQDEFMEPDEYRKLVAKWNFRHRGVNRAHKVGILEVGKFNPIPVNLRQLQFTEMRHLTRDQILEAFRVNKNQLGATDDVNRAASLAADDTYAKRAKLPRVRKWSSLINSGYLSCFGAAGQAIKACPENVVPEDEEAENAERTSKASAFKTYIDAGLSYDDASMLCGLPTGLQTRTETGPIPAVAARLDRRQIGERP